eukprot:49310-Ditylum_brightwellii.AAC.1
MELDVVVGDALCALGGEGAISSIALLLDGVGLLDGAGGTESPSFSLSWPVVGSDMCVFGGVDVRGECSLC